MENLRFNLSYCLFLGCRPSICGEVVQSFQWCDDVLSATDADDLLFVRLRYSRWST